jgi:hypothetical protein
MIDFPLPVGMTMSASSPLSAARIGSHCPVWKSSCPNLRSSTCRARAFESVAMRPNRAGNVLRGTDELPRPRRFPLLCAASQAEILFESPVRISIFRA